MPDEPSFFKGRRPSVYFKGGRLIKDKKTDIRYWRLKWALTVEAADARACGGAIQANFEHLNLRKNSAEKIELAGLLSGIVAAVYAVQDDTDTILRLDGCLIDKFSMTWADGMTEFWLQLEHVMTDQLHNFVKTYAFQRFYVEFLPNQRSIAEAIAENMKEPGSDLQDLAERHGASMTLTSGGKTLAEFKPKGKVN